MPKNRLSKKLLLKVASKSKHKLKYVREQISKRASRLSINAEAALILWAKELGIGTAAFQHSLPPHIQLDIRNSLSSPAGHIKSGRVLKSKRNLNMVSSKSLINIDDLIQDDELRNRCKDLLMAKDKFDRVIREATTVLDHRIKKAGGLKNINPVDAVGKVLNPDPNKAILKISEEKSLQEGFFSICKGLMLAFRDPAHHEITDNFSREEAIKFCGLVDIVLGAISKSSKIT
ncbi:MAG: TIGR02391 family protein [Candidatus Omnitrophota bacterium]|jgi:hypothetical protein